MRLFLLPINSRNTLIYAQRLNKQLTAEPTRIEKLSARANGLWQRWESRDKGWQKRVTTWGNRLFTRIPYQEWGLKSIPPLSTRKKGEDIQAGDEKVEILFPGKVLPEEQVPSVLRKLTIERQSFHRQRMLGSLAAMPLTIPFALIPVVPNLPFMYLAFRCYSHWKALAGARHVAFLMDNTLIKYSQSTLLQKIYDIKKLPEELLGSLKGSLAKDGELETHTDIFAQAVEEETAPADSVRSVTSQELLITEETGHLVSLCFGIPQVDAEIARAIGQVKKQIADEESQASDQSKENEKEKKQ